MAENSSKKPSQSSQSNEGVSRRKFIKNTGLVTGGVIGGSLLGGVFGRQWLDDEDATSDTEVETAERLKARMFFKRQEDFIVLSAATETIFPEDDHGPGAIGLNVPYFIDRQLAGTWGTNEKVYMEKPFQDGETPLNRGEILLQGVRRINEVSQDEYGEVFPDLEEEERIEVLQLFDDGEIEMNYVESSDFFELLRQMTLEGAYSDPMYGGNKNMEGWKMKEYPGAQTTLRHMMEEGEEIDQEFVVIEPISLSDQ